MKADFIRDICLSLPDVQEDIKWGHDLCFLIADKMFCITGIEVDFGVTIKVKDDDFDELKGREGIIPAPYLARYKWIYINNPNVFSLSEWKFYLGQSYRLIKSKTSSKPGNKKKKKKT